MKLIAAIFLAAMMATSAQAATRTPTALRGNWCWREAIDYRESWYERGRCEALRIRPKRIIEVNYRRCELLRLTGPVNRRRGYLYKITMRCRYDGLKTVQIDKMQIWHVRNGQLIVDIERE